LEKRLNEMTAWVRSRAVVDKLWTGKPKTWTINLEYRAFFSLSAFFIEKPVEMFL
jgi:hypothetical protein